VDDDLAVLVFADLAQLQQFAEAFGLLGQLPDFDDYTEVDYLDE